MRTSTSAKNGASGPGVSGTSPRAPDSRYSSAEVGIRSRTWRRSTMARASEKVVGSGESGPEAMTSGGSPNTSDRINARTLAGTAMCAMRPPLRRSRCLRTQLSSSMVAPARSNVSVVPRTADSATPVAGRVMSAEPPPEIRQSRKSSAPSWSTSLATAWAPRWLPSVGTGCPPRKVRRLPRLPISVSVGAMTTPAATRGPRISQAARAMAVAALPTATT